MIHAGTPPQYVSGSISELFHGRTGRIWHTLILAKWKEFFLWLPIESVIHQRQEEYYQAINLANNQGESTVFVKFMLEIIKQVLDDLTVSSTRVMNTVDESPQDRLLKLLRGNRKLSAKKLAEKLDLSERQVQRLLKNMKDQGIIKRSGTSRTGEWIIL